MNTVTGRRVGWTVINLLVVLYALIPVLGAVAVLAAGIDRDYVTTTRPLTWRPVAITLRARSAMASTSSSVSVGRPHMK